MPDDSSHPRRGSRAADSAWLDKTQLVDGPPQPDPGLSGVARLTCVGGPATGREFSLPPEGEVIIGRAPENAVSLQDSSVSRRHALVRWREESWLVSDLHSGHGTLLNGIRVDGDVALSTGDIIAVGNSALRFTDPRQASSQRSSEDTDLDRTQGSMGGVTGTHTGSGRTQIVLDPSFPEAPPFMDEGEAPPAPPERAPRRTASPPPPAGVPRKSVSTAPPRASPQAPPAGTQPSPAPRKRATHLSGPAPARPAPHEERHAPSHGARQEASAPKGRRNLLLWGALIGSLCLIPILARATVNVIAERRARQEQEARRALEEAFEQGKALMDSGQWEEAKAQLQRVQQMDPSFPVQDLIDRVEREQANAELLEAASVAVRKGQLEQASKALLKVSTDTTLREEVARVRGSLGSKVTTRLRDARAAFRAKRYDEVLAISSEILKAFPEHREARTLRDQVLILRARSGGKRR